MKQLFHILCLMSLVAMLMTACGESHQQMVLQLEELERQNRADSLMLNDSLALRLADYFDRHGSANERLRAHYILGRTYADMGEAPAALSAYLDAADCADTTQADCDYRTLSRVYGQMSDVFYWQNLMEDYIQSLNKSIKYAWKDKDTLQALNEEAHIIAAYNRLGQLDKVIITFDEVFNKLLQKYGAEYAAKFCILPIHALLKKGHMEKAKTYIDLLKTKSGYFDADGTIEKGRETCYFYIGRYYLLSHKIDSAEYFFRKEFSEGKDVTNQSMASRGLSLLFAQEGRLDSATKYALYSYEMNDSVYAQMATEEVEQAKSLYNYSRHQSIANKEHERAERERKAKNMLFLAVALALVAIGSIVYAWRRRKKAAEARYESIAASLKRAEGELANLHALEAEKTDLQALSDELYRQIAAKEAAVGHLQREIAQLRRENVPQVSVAEQQLSQSDLYRRLHQSAKCEAIPEEEWQAIDAMVRDTLPGYHRFLSSLRYSPDSNEYRICLLLRLHIRMQDASGFIGISKSRLSQISTDILEDVFAIKGSGKELQKQLERME